MNNALFPLILPLLLMAFFALSVVGVIVGLFKLGKFCHWVLTTDLRRWKVYQQGLSKAFA